MATDWGRTPGNDSAEPRPWNMRLPQPAPWSALALPVLRLTWRCASPCSVSDPRRLPDMGALQRWHAAASPAFANGFSARRDAHDHEVLLRAEVTEIGEALHGFAGYLARNFPHARVMGLEIAAHANEDERYSLFEDASPTA